MTEYYLWLFTSFTAGCLFFSALTLYFVLYDQGFKLLSFISGLFSVVVFMCWNFIVGAPWN